jgi:4-amino-4-deoxy-L-arabinose transferase-like glycosyltransferase
MGHKNKNHSNKHTPSHWEMLSTWLFSDLDPRYAVPLLAFLTAALLVPFASKAFHMDDPLFLKAAHQIIAHPFDPYGFTVNWYISEMPMAEVMKNPPLTSYYIAATAFLFGWSEVALHLAFLPFAILIILGVYKLARQYEIPPVLPALALLISPYFLISSSSIMCDNMMLSMFLWSIILWIDGIRQNSLTRLISAGLLVTLAGLTKYFGLSALPLMLIYAILHQRRLTLSLLILVLPVIVFIGYQEWTSALYGHGLLSDAAKYADFMHSATGSTAWGKIIIGFGFVGSLLPFTFLLAPRLFRIYTLIGLSLLSFAAALLVISGMVVSGAPTDPNGFRPLLTFELLFWIFMGLLIMTVVATSWKPGDDPDIIVLLLWVAGVFIFGCVMNWTVNARTLLPLGPPAAVLFVRRLHIQGTPSAPWTVASLMIGALLGLSVCWGDYRIAGTDRGAAERILNLPRSNRTIWFQGHWGFQHYMEEGGAKAIDVRTSKIAPGDIIIVPGNNTNTFPIDPTIADHVGYIELPSSPWVTTRSSDHTAGFYSHLFGLLPFVFESVPPERYDAYKYRNHGPYGSMTP